MKELQLNVNVKFLAELKSGENSKKSIIIPYGSGKSTVPPTGKLMNIRIRNVRISPG